MSSQEESVTWSLVGCIVEQRTAEKFGRFHPDGFHVFCPGRLLQLVSQPLPPEGGSVQDRNKEVQSLH